MVARTAHLQPLDRTQRPAKRPIDDTYAHALDTLNWLAVTLAHDLEACQAINHTCKALERRRRAYQADVRRRRSWAARTRKRFAGRHKARASRAARRATTAPEGRADA